MYVCVCRPECLWRNEFIVPPNHWRQFFSVSIDVCPVCLLHRFFPLLFLLSAEFSHSLQPPLTNNQTCVCLALVATGWLAGWLGVNRVVKRIGFAFGFLMLEPFPRTARVGLHHRFGSSVIPESGLEISYRWHTPTFLLHPFPLPWTNALSEAEADVNELTAGFGWGSSIRPVYLGLYGDVITCHTHKQTLTYCTRSGTGRIAWAGVPGGHMVR